MHFQIFTVVSSTANVLFDVAQAMAGGAQAAEAAVLVLLLVLAVGELGLPEIDVSGTGDMAGIVAAESAIGVAMAAVLCAESRGRPLKSSE